MNDNKWFFIFLAWIVSLISTSGSLFFSNVMGLPPCELCWFQRICMYPLVIILATGLLPFDKKVIGFSLPLGVIGWLIAFYHNLLYYRILPKSFSPCVQGISCTTIQINWFGFITIPLLSLISFTLIVTLLIYAKRISSNEK